MKKPKLISKRLNGSKDFEDAELLNYASYYDYVDRLKRIALSMFEWQNLPDTMDARFLEMCLFYTGKAAVLSTEETGYINTQITGDSSLNLYNLPTSVNCFSHAFQVTKDVYNPALKTPQQDRAVMVFNNIDHIPTAGTIWLFAERMANIDRCIDTNINAQRTPVLILSDLNNSYTLKNMYQQYSGNMPVIYGYKNGIAGDEFKTLKTDAPFIADKLYDIKTSIWNEALSFLGVNNIRSKKERLITDEADANNEYINLNLEYFLSERKRACEQINQCFGLNVDVKVRSDIGNYLKTQESIFTTNIKEETENE